MTQRRAIALIPCRLDSTRLPGKALLDVSGKHAIRRLVEQIERSSFLQRSEIVVCTTTRPSDDALANAVGEMGAQVFRGHTDDLIDRLYHATVAFPSDLVAEIDGDDICADPDYMDIALAMVERGDAEVAFSGDNLPLGAGTKAFRADCLARVHECYVPGKNDTGFGYYLTKSELFDVKSVACMNEHHHLPNLRLTLDYPEDLEVFRRIYAEADRLGEVASLDFICNFARRSPEIMEINANLDESYWERTGTIMAANPLQLRRGNTVYTVGPES
jgi:spore coat polysaccharide biosynthesis protein SpsF